MPKLAKLAVYANPWHGPLDHNHRACSAVPWDPSDNPSRGFVGAQHRLDDNGELYFEYAQFDGTHGVRLELRDRHEPITLPATMYYIDAVKNGSLWPANEATHKQVFGADHTKAHFQSPEKRAAAAPQAALNRHAMLQGEEGDAAEPTDRPRYGEGRFGPQNPHRTPGSVNAAHQALQDAIAETAKKAAEAQAKGAKPDTAGGKSDGKPDGAKPSLTPGALPATGNKPAKEGDAS